jgi:hypothetical protein
VTRFRVAIDNGPTLLPTWTAKHGGASAPQCDASTRQLVAVAGVARAEWTDGDGRVTSALRRPPTWTSWTDRDIQACPPA